MPAVSETIPAALQADVDKALAWYNAEYDVVFSVTGIVDADEVAAPGPKDLKLVLCGGDMCRQESFRVDGDVVFLIDPLHSPA